MKTIKIERILAVVAQMQECAKTLPVVAKLAKKHEAGVTLLYVHEEKLFELPVYEGERLDLEGIRAAMKREAAKAGLEDAALLVYANDLVDRAVLEAQREEDAMIVTAYRKEDAHKLAFKCGRPLLVLKEAKGEYTKAVVSIDSVAETERCLDFLQAALPQTKLHLYQDFQYFSQPIADPFVDPMIEPYDMSIETMESNEMIQARKEAFYTLCETRKLEGTFLMGDKGIEEDVVAFLKEQGADLLVFDLLDDATLLAMALEDTLALVETDTLVCTEMR